MSTTVRNKGIEGEVSSTNKVAIVTGANRGIGNAIASRLASDGYNIVFTYRGKDQHGIVQAEFVMEELKSYGTTVCPVQTDISTADGAQKLIDTALTSMGRIDVLINNAGITRDGPFLRMKEGAWTEVIQTNLTSAYHLCQLVIKQMIMKQRSGGRIVNISSVVGQTGNKMQANYAASKAGLIGLTMSLAQEFGSRGICINAVAPGFISTQMTEVLPQEYRDDILARTPLGRMGTPEDVANAVAFLVSDQASFITGHVLEVNGGLHMG